ncbi:RagB/SusD family nutrient uptake outer membrane protein [Parapedobacter tibetensis]|uniref:RagB/SusD family nutrient uptake outer membrane protein n=1 Tax=Parapedobacter tibetensis TaxID=2972951 RepID=UPI00214DE240|nr:RagB/SusD family nutrient uptake outer membrane protein [Parapedobacter tibetensis]
MKRIKSIFTVVAMAGVACACQGFLDVKPDKSLTVPSGLDDLLSLLDNQGVYLTVSNAGEISSDDFHVTDEDLASLSSDWHRRIYAWESDFLFENRSRDWNVMFATPIYYCNSMLEHLENIERNTQNQALFDNIKGSAKLIRARTLFHASLIWTLAYDERTAGSTLGLPLRKSTDFNELSVRASLKETYDFILADLQESVALLPETPLHVVRPSKPAAYGLLARIHLYMGDYEKAFSYADSCLRIKDTLMDYNELDTDLANPIPQYNPEVILDYAMVAEQVLSISRARIKPEIINSYESGDLRQRIFFTLGQDGIMGFRGSYSGMTVTLFAGIATDEIYLIRAECSARMGNVQDALADLNRLLSKRYENREGTSLHMPITSGQWEEVLQVVMEERRKELIFRGLRWYDLKRLNRDGANIEMVRLIDGQQRTFPPSDLRYSFGVAPLLHRKTNGEQAENNRTISGEMAS